MLLIVGLILFLIFLLIFFIIIFFKIKFLKNILKYDKFLTEEKQHFFYDFGIKNFPDVHYFKYELDYFNKKLEDICNCETNADLKKYKEKYGYDSERFHCKRKKD